MKKNQLGLPLEYNKLSAYFTSSKNSKNRVIEKILRKYKVKTVLDLSCGTGSQVFWLTKRKYKVVGVDISPALLKIARDKAHQEKIDVKFIKGDMRITKAGKFDAVITIFNSIGHLTKNDFAKTLKNINKNLKKSGLYIFDIFNLHAMTDKAVANLAMEVRRTVGNKKIRNVQYSQLNRKSGRLTSYDKYWIQEGSNKSKIFTGKFTLQIYSAEELREMLIKAGFNILAQYDLNGSQFRETKSQSILTVAMKIFS